MQEYINKIVYGNNIDVLPNIKSKSVDLVITDPPYGISYEGRWRFPEKIQGDEKDAYLFFKGVAMRLYRVLKDNTHIYVFTRWDVMQKFVDALKYAGFDVMNAIAVRNSNHGLGSLEYQFAPKYEIVLFGMKGRRKFNQTTMKKRKGTKNYVYRFPDFIDWLDGDEKNKATALHPMQKSLEIIEFFMLLSSNENDLVLDPFCGSGVVAVASMDLNRRFICIEKDKKYYDASLKYIEMFKSGELSNKLKDTHKNLNISSIKKIESFI